MTGPDSTHQQNPQQPQWAAGPPGGQYPGAGQYPVGGQYPGAGQYPTGAQYPAGPSTGGGPADNQVPAGQYGNYPSGNPYSAAPSPPVQAYRPGQAWDTRSTQHEPFPAGVLPGPGGFGTDRPQGPAAPSRSAGRRRVVPAKLFGLTIAVLGGLNFILGFLPEVSAPRTSTTLSVYAVGPAYVPILLLIAGLLALAAFLPGSERSRLAVAAVSVGGAAGAIVSLGTPGSIEQFANPNQVSTGLGAILLVVFGIVQAVIAVGAYVVGADTLWKPGSDPDPVAPAAAAAGPAARAATGSAAGPGPIDPSLVGVYPPMRPGDVGSPYPGQGGAGWPAAPDGAQRGWVGRGVSSDYSQNPGFGNPGQAVTSVTSGDPSQSRPRPVAEPVTGPQIVVGMETVRVEVRKVSDAGVPPISQGDDGRDGGSSDDRPGDQPGHPS